MKIKTIALACGFFALSTAQLNVQAADVKAGRDAFETCRGCHSLPGYSNVYPAYHVPKIGGQVPLYTIAALKAYRDGSRSHGTMKANTYDLSDEKIENIAAYIAKSTGGSSKTTQNGGSISNGKKLAQTCLACHNDDKSAEAINPRLAGQHASYLEKAIKEYQSGKRQNPVMQSMVSGLSGDDIKDISAYFASLRGLTATE